MPIAAPRNASARARPCDGLGGVDCGGGTTTTGGVRGADVADSVEPVLTAAEVSTVPLPTNGSQPGGGRCAVDSIRFITCRAVQFGNRARISAASPLTIGAA